VIANYIETIETEYEGIKIKVDIHWGKKESLSFSSIYNECLRKEQKRKMDSLCQKFDSWIVGLLDGHRER
jgi:hypothetical protein